MKRMLLLITFLASAPLAHGMHKAGAEPEAKKVEWQILEQPIASASQIEPGYAQWLEIQDSSIVSLESGNGVVFALPIRIAQQSKTIRDLIEDVGVDNQIPLPNIDTETLAGLAELMQTIDRFQMMREKDELFYIPRALQPVFNQILAQASLELLAKLITAANYLDHPFIMNGVAAIIADRIFNSIPEQLTLDTNNPQKLYRVALAEAIRKKQKEEKFRAIRAINKNIQPWIRKHLTHRVHSISEEYSVADYIKKYGQPPLEIGRQNNGSESLSRISALSNIKLTSLYGITLLQHRATIRELVIENNCFYDFAFDPQPAQDAFSEFVNLETLKLNENQLSRLQAGFFRQLPKLTLLDLYGNKIRDLPIEVFTGLANLSTLKLDRNKLISLQNGTFNSTPKLRILNLSGNRKLRPMPPEIFPHLCLVSLTNTALSQEEQTQISQTMQAMRYCK